MSDDGKTKPGDLLAFPRVIYLEKVSLVSDPGLTKREMFAMAAMQGMLSGGLMVDYRLDEIAKDATVAADALLTELGKVKP